MSKFHIDMIKSRYAKMWTPAESGKLGQGCVGNLRPSIVQEAWQMTMYWARGHKPKPGTKFLVCGKGQCVVASAGFERGPRSTKLLLGISPEITYYTGKIDVTVGRLEDQSLKYGPIKCGGK